MILTLAVMWIVFTLVNFVHTIVIRAVSILERQKNLWFQTYDGLMFKVYRPTMMLAEVIALSMIIFKIASKG
jgi:hypothetical protein